MSDLLTIVTCTVGDSVARLDLLLRELRKYASLPMPRHVVSDDGTICNHVRANQHQVCMQYGAEYTENPGPTWGISYNWNHAFSKVTTPWAYCVEDGLRPSWGWLEAAVDFIKKIGSEKWQGFPVGMAGATSVQDWVMAMGRAIPGVGVMEAFDDPGNRTNAAFYGDWNDGYWCWRRLLKGFYEACAGDTSRWHHDVLCFRDILLQGLEHLKIAHPYEKEQLYQKFRTHSHWPARRYGGTGWYPGAFMLVNMEAWNRVGKFRDGCTFFEGHLGMRMALNGYLSLVIETPLWMHRPSQGFRAADVARTPRHHEDTDAVFRRDFEGMDHMDSAQYLANRVISLDMQRRVCEDLSRVPLDVCCGWEEWL